MISNEDLVAIRKYIAECIIHAKNERKVLLFKVMETFPREIAKKIVQSVSEGLDPIHVVEAYRARVGGVHLVDDAGENFGKIRWIN